jgi:hypothetical protein
VFKPPEDEVEIRVRMRVREVAADRGELLGRGVLKGIDRLFLVADREDRAPDIARAGA